MGGTISIDDQVFSAFVGTLKKDTENFTANTSNTAEATGNDETLKAYIEHMEQINNLFLAYQSFLRIEATRVQSVRTAMVEAEQALLQSNGG